MAAPWGLAVRHCIRVGSSTEQLHNRAKDLNTSIHTMPFCLLITHGFNATSAEDFLWPFGLPPYTCNGNNANQLNPVQMNTIDKHTAVMTALAERTTLLQRCKRINIEQKYPPYFRTFVAVQQQMETTELRAIEDIATEHGLISNPFRTGMVVSAITLVDMDEKMSS